MSIVLRLSIYVLQHEKEIKKKEREEKEQQEKAGNISDEVVINF
jgi:hypothetical protein